MDGKYYMPKSIDEPFKIFLLSVDEFVLLVLSIILIGIVMRQMMLSLIVGVGGCALLKKIKGGQGNAYIFKLVYWYLPPIMIYKSTPSSTVRDYL